MHGNGRDGDQSPEQTAILRIAPQIARQPGPYDRRWNKTFNRPVPVGPLENAMIGKLDAYLRFNETALNLRGQRQQLIASNIANADTPNYKSRDIDFNGAMRLAMARGPEPSQGLVKTATNHLSANTSSYSANASGVNGVPLLYRTIQQGAIDGNTVDMDAERNQFADNAIRYEAGITMISGQIKSMLSAIQG